MNDKNKNNLTAKGLMYNLIYKKNRPATGSENEIKRIKNLNRWPALA
jgi:hypothetical protein